MKIHNYVTIPILIALCFVAPDAMADEPVAPVVAPFDAGVTLDAGVAPAPAPTAPETKLPDPATQPQESIGLVTSLYKAGQLVPMLIVLGFFVLTLLQKWIAWLRAGWRKLAVTAALAGLGMLAERIASGTTPNLAMMLGALGVVFSAIVNFKGEPAAPKETPVA